jgi:hypothetical protein
MRSLKTDFSFTENSEFSHKKIKFPRKFQEISELVYKKIRFLGNRTFWFSEPAAGKELAT